jgi:hypothetical protein
MGAQALFPTSTIVATVTQATEDLVSGFHGHLAEEQANVEAKIILAPTANWTALGLAYPAAFGVKIGATAAALAVGTRIHTGAPAVIWTPDARLYTFVNAALSKPPDLHLGVGKALFGDLEIACIGDLTKAIGTAAFLYTIAESAGADPGGHMGMADYVNGQWTGVYGAVAGFGAATPMQAEEEWTVSSEVKLQPLTVQKLCRGLLLTSVRYMVKARLVGPTQTQIDAAIGFHSSRLLGSRFASGTPINLVLTDNNSHTITLKNADVKGVGFEFGGSRLGTGETAFVNAMTFTAGVPDSLIEFSTIAS